MGYPVILQRPSYSDTTREIQTYKQRLESGEPPPETPPSTAAKGPEVARIDNRRLYGPAAAKSRRH